MGIAFQFTKSMALSMCVPLFCYIVVAGYAFWGSRIALSLALAEASPSEVYFD